MRLKSSVRISSNWSSISRKLASSISKPGASSEASSTASRTWSISMSLLNRADGSSRTTHCQDCVAIIRYQVFVVRVVIAERGGHERKRPDLPHHPVDGLLESRITHAQGWVAEDDPLLTGSGPDFAWWRRSSKSLVQKIIGLPRLAYAAAVPCVGPDPGDGPNGQDEDHQRASENEPTVPGAPSGNTAREGEIRKMDWA